MSLLVTRDIVQFVPIVPNVAQDVRMFQNLENCIGGGAIRITTIDYFTAEMMCSIIMSKSHAL